MDPWVLEAQQWVNSTYSGQPGYVVAPENGQTGWPTMFSLTRGLQIELGIAQPSDTFGPATMAAVDAIAPIGTGSGAPSNVVKILQSALWCKGYAAGAIDGDFGPVMTGAIVSVQTNLGVASLPGSGTVDAKLFRTLLTMDAYVRVGTGTDEVRAIQQWLNLTYIEREPFRYVPTDGRFSRDVQRGLIYGLQFELGLSDTVATGTFGPTTRSLLQAQPTLVVDTYDTTHHFVRLYQAGLTFNGYTVVFDGHFGRASSNTTSTFQSFAALPVTGAGDFTTWCSLLVSTGDPDRPVSGMDTTHSLAPDGAAGDGTVGGSWIATSLLGQGYEVAARYLTNAPIGIDKQIRADEIALANAAGVAIVPVYQTSANYLGYFSYTQGQSDGHAAYSRFRRLGLPDHTVVYFAVDFDATDAQIDAVVLPHFEGIRDYLTSTLGGLTVGVYGTRNVCARVTAAQLAQFSFVAGLSTGWSGNLGFPLPSTWVLDQIQETTLTVDSGSASQVITADRNAYSGASDGVTFSLEFERSLTALAEIAGDYVASDPGPNPNKLLCHPFRVIGGYEGLEWIALAGPIDYSFVSHANYEMLARTGVSLAARYADPNGERAAFSPHLLATLNVLLHWDLPDTHDAPRMSDVGGWLGDLFTFAGDYLLEHGGTSGLAHASAWVQTNLGHTGTFGQLDLHQDMDAINARFRMEVIPDAAAGAVWALGQARQNSPSWRFQQWLDNRFDGSVGNLASAANIAMTYNGTDPVLAPIAVARNRLVDSERGVSWADFDEPTATGIASGFVLGIQDRL